MIRATHLLAGALLAAAAPALAQDETAPPPAAPDNGDTITIGLGAGISPSYEGSDSYNIIPGGIVSGKVSGFSFFMRGLQLYADVIREPEGETIDIGLGPVAGLRLNRTSRIGDAQVRALGKLDEAIEVGAWAGVAKTGIITSAYDNLAFRVTYLRDVANAHDSYVVTPSIEYGTPLSTRTYVGLSLSADYAGDGYASYYFNVTPAGAAASGLDAYQADGGFKNVSFGLLGGHSLSGDLREGGWSLFAIGIYSRLLGDFKDSPIVAQAGDADQWFGAAGIAYTF